MINRKLDSFENLHLHQKKPSKENNIAELLVETYKLLISDFDGDNCSFSPSCSEFFVQSTKSTNFFTSFLLFFDRLTRDTNIFSKADYITVDGRYYDPPSEYILEH
jgi:putative component of membrane protein insertase Oxa1/YidC/SpoIIIJ protein YidD